MGTKEGIILGKTIFKDIKDKSMDSIFIVDENISNVFSNTIIDNVLSTWQDNIIILDFKDELYLRNHFIRKDMGEMINFSEEDLYYNPFLLAGKTEDYFERDMFKKYTDIVTDMYEITGKYFKMDNTYKGYVIDLIISAIYFLKENKKNVSINNLITFFSCKESPLEKRMLDLLESTINVKIYKPIVNFFNLESYHVKNKIMSSIINILKTFENDDFYIFNDYENANENGEYDNEEINKIFGEDKYTLFVSLNSLEDKLSKAKIKFLINQILKNRKKIKNKTLFILPDFEIFNDIPEIKEILFYDDIFAETKLLLIGNAQNLINFYKKSLLKNTRILLSSDSLKEVRNLKYSVNFPINKELEKHEMLYINKSVYQKIDKLNCTYEKKYIIKDCLKLGIIILFICLYYYYLKG